MDIHNSNYGYSWLRGVVPFGTPFTYIQHVHTICTTWINHWAHNIQLSHTTIIPWCSDKLKSFTPNILTHSHNYKCINYIMHILHTDGCYALAQLLGFYATYTLYTHLHVYTTLGSHMHLRYRHNCYLLAQLLGSYARYTPYTQYLFYGPVTGLMSHIHHIDTTATAQLMGPIHTNSAYMESLPPGPVTGLTSCIYQIHPLLLLMQQLSQYHAHALNNKLYTRSKYWIHIPHTHFTSWPSRWAHITYTLYTQIECTHSLPSYWFHMIHRPIHTFYYIAQ